MIPAEPLPHEEERLASLFRQGILDSPEEQDFDDLVQLAAQMCGSKIALVSLVDDHRQWFKARVGLDATETPKEVAFCAHAIHGDDIFEIRDAWEDERFADNPLVTGDPKVRFYAGKPIRATDGQKLGTLCVIDNYPRQLTPIQRQTLNILARQVETQIELRYQLYQLDQSLKVVQSQTKSLQQLNEMKDQVFAVLSHDLRSPLSNLESIINCFNDDYLSGDEMLEMVQEITPQIQKTKGQLSQVLEWAQQQMIKQSVAMEAFSVEVIARQGLQWVQEQAQTKKVNLITEFEGNFWAVGDGELVNLVLRNLLVNAVKYCCCDDQVTLFAQQEEDYVRLA